MPNVAFTRQEVRDKKTQWTTLEDTLAGEEAVKAKGETYLPKPICSSDPVEVENRFTAYLKRAVFYPVTNRTLKGLLGQVFSKDPKVDLPPLVGSMGSNVDGAGTSLEQQSKTALSRVLSHGRCGLLVDFPALEEDRQPVRADIENGTLRPRILLYEPGQIINWREESQGGETFLSMLVLHETAIIEDDGFEYETEDRWREFRIVDGGVQVQVWRKPAATTGKVVGNPEAEFEVVEGPFMLKQSGDKPFTKIPFRFIGAENNDPSVDDSPLAALANLNVAHFRNSADYEDSSFLVGQPTPVFSGLTEKWAKTFFAGGKVVLGSRSPIVLPEGANATLMAAEANGQPMEAMKHKEDQMKAIGAKLIEPNRTERTATEASLEADSEASVLSSAAKNVSDSYNEALALALLFLGEVVDPSGDDSGDEGGEMFRLNSEFSVASLNATERAEVVAAWQAGILAKPEVRETYRKAGIATLPNDEAEALIQGEQEERIAMAGGGIGGNEDEDEEEEDEEEGDDE